MSLIQSRIQALVLHSSGLDQPSSPDDLLPGKDSPHGQAVGDAILQSREASRIHLNISSLVNLGTAALQGLQTCLCWRRNLRYKLFPPSAKTLQKSNCDLLDCKPYLGPDSQGLQVLVKIQFYAWLQVLTEILGMEIFSEKFLLKLTSSNRVMAAIVFARP